MDPTTALASLDSLCSPTPLDMVDQFSFLDVCLEDDSLLPLGSNEGLSSHSQDHDSPSVIEASDKMPDTDVISATIFVQENILSCQDISDKTADVDLPLLTEEPVLKTKKKKNGFNLRKSLAWNNAFITEEGVLDSEELSIVNKTFQKVPENPKPSSHRQFTQASKLLKPVMIPKAHLSSQRITSCMSGQQNLAIATTHSSRSSVNSLIGTGLKRPEQCLSNSNGSIGIRHGTSKPPLTSRVESICLNQEKSVTSAHIEDSQVEHLQKTKETDKCNSGSGPLTSSAIGRREIDEMEPSRRSVTFASESISIKGTSHPKPRTLNSKSFSLSGKAEGGKMQKLPFTAIYRSQSASTAAKITTSTNTIRKPSHLEKPGMVSRDKPSGLRMPSPKLGFFDSSRMASQVATSSTENISSRNNTTTRLDVDGDSNNMQNTRLKLPTASLKSRQVTESSVINNNRGTDVPSCNTTSGPLTRITEIPSMSAALLGSGRSSLNLTNRKKLENSTQVLQAKNNVYNKSPHTESPKALFSVKDTPGQENSYLNWQVGKGISQNSVDQDALLRLTNSIKGKP